MPDDDDRDEPMEVNGEAVIAAIAIAVMIGILIVALAVT